MSEIISKISTNITEDLSKVIGSPSSIFILTDETTAKLCLPTLMECPQLKTAKHFCIPKGEENKNIETLCSVWQFLSDNGATRQSLLINLGGGVVTDLGGMAAATFKRGMPFINIPTTLLAAIDASTGGKNGIDFNHLKNEVGIFKLPEKVLIYTDFFKTLSPYQMYSGYAEMIKHALIADPILLEQTLRFDLDHIDYKRFNYLIEENLTVKRIITESDPMETGRRKALNFGHTIGHALEIYAMRHGKPISHGHAVMWGIIGELFLSRMILNFPKETLQSLLTFTKEEYATIEFTCKEYPELLDLMRHDKKNISTEINFTLLAQVGDIRVNQSPSAKEIKAALDFIREA